MSALSDAIRRRRMALGLTQTEMAAAVGVDKAHMCRIEAGVRTPAPELREALIARLGLEDDATYALAVTSSAALLRNYAALTHAMHGQHRIDCADERAQRDLIEAELLSRLGEA